MTTKQILGVKFLSDTAAEAVDVGLRGGLVVVPSAPVLVGIARDPTLRMAVLGADLAITDSGLMVLLWWLLTGEKLERVSGLEYLKLLLEKLQRTADDGGRLSAISRQASEHGGVFWVMPTAAARDKNLAWLRSQGFSTTAEDCYLAPQYGEGELHDEALVALIRRRRPAHVIIALGGGVQERLGFALKQSLAAEDREQRTEDSAANPQVSGLKSQVSVPSSGLRSQVSGLSGAYRPGIHCIGAAIGFLSGEQVRIPMWVDYLYMGWLWRSVSAPRKFAPRYWKAWRLVGLMIRYREKAPVARKLGD